MLIDLGRHINVINANFKTWKENFKHSLLFETFTVQKQSIFYRNINEKFACTANKLDHCYLQDIFLLHESKLCTKTSHFQSQYDERIKNVTPKSLKKVIFNIRMRSCSWAWDFKMCFRWALWGSLLVDLPRLMTQCCSSCRTMIRPPFLKTLLCSYLFTFTHMDILFIWIKLTFFFPQDLYL